MSGEDRRRHPRHKKDAPLILLHKTPPVPNEGAILRDVSIGGLAFETSLPLKNGDRFEFTLFVPEEGWVDGVGEVCWTKPEGDRLLCGAAVEIKKWKQKKILERWLDHPIERGVLRFFFPGEGVLPPEPGTEQDPGKDPRN